MDDWCFPTCSHWGGWNGQKSHKLIKKRASKVSNYLHLYLHFSLVVEVHSINNFLLPILDNFPNGSSNHVSSWKRSDGKTVSLPCEAERNTIFIIACPWLSVTLLVMSCGQLSPFRFTIWEYFNCWILSKALSTSSRVKSVNSSLLFRDCRQEINFFFVNKKKKSCVYRYYQYSLHSVPDINHTWTSDPFCRQEWWHRWCS